MRNPRPAHRFLPVLLIAFAAALIFPTSASMQRDGQACGFGGRCDSGWECLFARCVKSAGTEGGSCRLSDTPCDSGLTCVAGLCVKPPELPDPGTNGGVCRGGSSCDSGLECLLGICSPRGGRLQICRSDGSCDPGLACAAFVCVDAGGLAQPCRPGGGCNSGLECVAGACVSPPPRGGPGQPCLAGSVCNSGLRCIGNICASVGGLLQRCRADGSCNANLACITDFCAPAGGPLQPCLPGNQCKTGLDCVNGACLPPPPVGGLAQPCRPDSTCDAGLQCRNFLCVRGPVEIRELPYELSLRHYLATSFGGRFDARAFQEATERAARLPIARLPILEAPSSSRPGTVTRPLTSPGPVWEYVGPNNLDVPYQTYYGVRPIAGRVNAVAYSPTNPQVIFAGSAAGGLFRSDDGGENWQPLSDEFVTSAGTMQPVWRDLHVSSIAFSPRNPDVIYVGLGDFHGQLPRAGGIMRSTDGGRTWTNLGFTDFGNFAVSNILVDADNPDIIVATTGRGPGGEGQVWRSPDAGATWTPTIAINAQWSGAAIGAASGSGVRAYYVAGTLPPPPGTSAPRLAIIQRSLDRGLTWTALMAPTTGDENVFALAASPTNSATVYGLLPKSQTIWRSDNAGVTWRDISAGFPSFGADQANYNWSQGGYDYFIACTRRASKDVLYVGLIDIVMSPDGGSTWSSIGGPTYSDRALTHNDQHGIAFHPSDPNEFLLANDGGVYRGRFDPDKNFTTFQSLNRRLPITMFYRAAFHPSDPNVMIGGTQDNATAVSTGNLQDWLNKGGGDGGGTAISQQRPNIQYATAQGFASPISGLPFDGLSFFRTDVGWRLQGGPLDGAQPPQQLIPPFTGNDRRSGQPNMPIFVDVTIDPGNSTVMYTGTQFLWRLDDTFPLAPWKWFKVSTTSLSTNSMISRIAVAPTSRDTIYTTSTDGEVWGSFDRGVNWTRLNRNAVAPLCVPNPFGGMLCPPSANALSVNPNDPNDILVGFAPAPGGGTLFRCTATNSGAPVWTDLSGTAGTNPLPNVALNAIVRDLDRPQTTFYVGTDLGVFMTDDAGANWFNAGTGLGLPAVKVNDLVVVPRTRFLNAATFGRGMWRLLLPEDRPAIDEFTVTPASASGGEFFTARVTLARTAPPTGVPVTFTSSNPAALPAPTPARIGGLQSELVLLLRATPGLADAPVTITATIGDTNKTVNVTVRRTEARRLTINPATVKGSELTSGTVFLSAPAPAGGASVTLSSSCGAVSVPPSINITVGGLHGNFDLQTFPIAQTQTCTISATLGVTQTAVVTVQSPALVSFGMDATEVTRGNRVGGFVELDHPAPPGGVRVRLKSSSWFLVVPDEVPINGGQRRAVFEARARWFVFTRNVTLSAWIGERTPQTPVLTTTIRVKWN